jgi:hypothetical protein
VVRHVHLPPYNGVFDITAMERPHVKKEMVFLVSRAFALLMIIWTFTEITSLPHNLFSLSEHMKVRSVLAPRDYWTNYYLILTVCNIVRTLVLFFVAVLFWRCGPWVEKLFSPQHNNQEPAE